MNKTFCALAWTHLHPIPGGTVSLCCDTQIRKVVGNLATHSLDEIATSEIMNDVRKKMQNGIEIPECDYCYEKEKSNIKSVRNMINEVYKDQIGTLIQNTNEDGSLTVPWQMKHFNLRISNLCNLSCRSCTPLYSSVIAQEQGEKKFVINIADTRPSFTKEIMEHLPFAESLTFVGGESVLIDEYWDIMDRLISLNNTDVKIFYFTNLSKIEHNGKNLIEYLKAFKNHRLLLSIDGYGDRLELLRNGSNWDKIHSNLRAVRDAKLNYTVFQTMSAINIWHIPDFEKFLIKEDLLKYGIVEHNTVVRPRILNTKILPLVYKDIVKNKIVSHQQFLIDNGYKYISDQWDNFLAFMYADDYSEKIKEFIEYNQELDAGRDQHLYQVYPELLHIKEYYEQQLFSQKI
jgi:sulfatase maturation enzyme AslB (radical SAM superfamily)